MKSSGTHFCVSNMKNSCESLWSCKNLLFIVNVNEEMEKAKCQLNLYVFIIHCLSITADLVMTVLHGPLEALIGAAFGIGIGLILWYIPHHKHVSHKTNKYYLFNWCKRNHYLHHLQCNAELLIKVALCSFLEFEQICQKC